MGPLRSNLFIRASRLCNGYAFALVTLLFAAPGITWGQGGAEPDARDPNENKGSWTVHEYRAAQETVPMQGLSLGVGWRRALSQQVAVRCVIGEEIPIEGSALDVSFYDTYDREQVTSALNVSAQASYAGISGSANFSRTAKVDRNRRNILAVVNVDKGGRQLAPPKLQKDAADSRVRLTKYALELLTEPGKKSKDKSDAIVRLANFQRHCGDAYVGGIRKGGQLAVMFNAQHSKQSLEEAFKASASGGMGGFAGSGSLSTSLAKAVQQGTTEVKTSQKGGLLVAEFGAKEVLDKIRTYATFEDKHEAPTVAVLVPYQTLPDWPVEMLDVGPTDLELRDLIAHGDRLATLGRLYADAAANPMRFYFPFTDASAAGDMDAECLASGDGGRVRERSVPCEAARIATGLYAAAACVQKLAAQCTMNIACNRDALSKVTSAKQFCPMLADTSDGARVIAYSLILPLKALYSANPSSKTGGTRDEDVIGHALKNRLVADGAKASGNGGGRTASKDVPWSIYDMYYKLLAAAPLARANSGTFEDEAEQVLLYCQTLSGRNCAAVERAALAEPAPANPTEAEKVLIDTRSRVYREWALSQRLMPRALSFCDLSPVHPMCKDPVSLMNLAHRLRPVFGSERHYIADAQADPGPAPPRYPDPVYGDGNCPRFFQPRCY